MEFKTITRVTKLRLEKIYIDKDYPGDYAKIIKKDGKYIVEYYEDGELDFSQEEKDLDLFYETKNYLIIRYSSFTKKARKHFDYEEIEWMSPSECTESQEAIECEKKGILPLW